MSGPVPKISSTVIARHFSTWRMVSTPNVALDNEAYKHKVKWQYDRSVHPHIFFEGDLVLVYDQDKDPLGAGKFKPMWFGPFIVKEVLKKGTYRLVDF